MSSTPIFSFGLPPPEAGLQALTIEYLEHMRCFCRQNDYDIQKLFEEYDPLGTGDVAGYTFLHIIHTNFWSQVGFSIEQIRVIAHLFINVLGEVRYKRLDEWMKSDDNMVDQMLQIHCTCGSLFPALVADIISSVCSSCLISPNPGPTTADFTSTTCLGSMFSLSPPSTPLPLLQMNLSGFGTASIFGLQSQIPPQLNCTGGELENPVRFTLGRTDKLHVRKQRRHRNRNTLVGSPSPGYSFRPFSPLNISFSGETSVSSSIINSIFGITEARVGEPVSQSSPTPVTAAESIQTLFQAFRAPSDTSVACVGGGDRGHLVPPKHYRNYVF